MNIIIATDGPELNDARLFAEMVKGLCESLVPTARLQVKHLPPLYQSGVRFQPEARGYESFALPLVVYKRRVGDCAHLAVWRLAECLNAGEKKAGLRIKWNVNPQVRLFHVQVRRGNGDIEDPSALLGMPQTSAI